MISIKKLLVGILLIILYFCVSNPELFPSTSSAIFLNAGIDGWPHKCLAHYYFYDHLHYTNSYELYIAEGKTGAAPTGIEWNQNICTTDDLYLFELNVQDHKQDYIRLQSRLPDQYGAWYRHGSTDDEVWQLMYDEKTNILFIYRLHHIIWE